MTWSRICDFLLSQAGMHVSKATEMIDDIADLARFDQGQQAKVSNDLIQLKELGSNVLAAVELPSSVQAVLELDGGGPAFVHSDARFLTKILCNLTDHLSSAVAPTESNRTVSLNIRCKEDTCTFIVANAVIDASENDDSILVESNVASNNGLPAIFQKYHQELLPEEMLDLDAVGSLRDKIESGINAHHVNLVGIGLPLSYHLVRALGGDLRYNSVPDVTKFWFSIPLNNGLVESETIGSKRVKRRRSLGFFLKSDENESKAAFRCSKTEVVTCGIKAMDSPTVLIVEDVAVCAKLLCAILRQANCSSKWVQNGQEAVEELRRDPNLYNLIFMDLRMPVMDGLTATRIIKNDLKVSTPIVALTGEGGAEIKEECKAIGFDAYCNKPLKRSELLKLIEKHTGYRNENNR